MTVGDVIGLDLAFKRLILRDDSGHTIASGSWYEDKCLSRYDSSVIAFEYYPESEFCYIYIETEETDHDKQKQYQN